MIFVSVSLTVMIFYPFVIFLVSKARCYVKSDVQNKTLVRSSSSFVIANNYICI